VRAKPTLSLGSWRHLNGAYQWLRQSDQDGVINAFADLDGDSDAEIRQTTQIHCVKQKYDVVP
jgi:hypothetical protein